MEKVFRIVKKGEDTNNLEYWAKLSFKERLRNLEILRQETNQRLYGIRQGFQRVYRIVKRSQS